MLILRHFICHLFLIFALFLRTENIFSLFLNLAKILNSNTTFELDNLRN